MKYIVFRVEENKAATTTLDKLLRNLNSRDLNKNPLSKESELIISKQHTDLICFLRYKLFFMFNLPTFVMKKAIKHWFKKNGYIGEITIYSKKEMLEILWDKLKS